MEMLGSDGLSLEIVNRGMDRWGKGEAKSGEMMGRGASKAEEISKEDNSMMEGLEVMGFTFIRGSWAC